MNFRRTFVRGLLVISVLTVAGASVRAQEKPATVKGYVLGVSADR